jgi:pentose-5-phosphate-3-epimerase
MPEALDRVAVLRSLVDVPIQVDGGVGETNARSLHDAGARLLVCGSAVFGDPSPGAAYGRIAAAFA